MVSKKVDTPLMKQYYQIKSKHPDAILLFRVGDFYETFSKDAIISSQVLGIALTKRANGSAGAVELAGFPYHALDNYLPKLVRKGYRVAVCDQLEDPKLTKTIVKRGVTELVTPGIVMNDNILEKKENNYLAAVYIDRGNNAGVSFLDISTGEFIVAQGSYDYINKLIAGFQPKELLINEKQKSVVYNKIEFKGFTFDLDDWAFAYDNNRLKLLQHFDVANLKGYGIDDMPLSISSAGAILNYLELTSHRKIGHITSIRRIDKTGFVRLDGFTVRSLELLSSTNTEGVSLLDVINKTQTAMGGRMLRRWLVFPLTNVEVIKQRQLLVSSLFDNNSLRDSIGELLSEIADIERLSSRASVGRISPREVMQLSVALEAIEEIKRLILKVCDNDSLRAWAEKIDSCKDLTSRIKKEIRPDAPMAIGRGDVICPGVSAELDELRALLTDGKDYILRMQQKESERTGIPSLKIAFNNVFGYYIEVRNTHKEKVPPEWVRKQTLVSAERYITDELKQYENKILGAQDSITRIENKIFEDIVSFVYQHILSLQRLSQEIASLDCYYSFAEHAKCNNYVCPEVNDGFNIFIKEGRHPVIETTLAHTSPYVPNDVNLSNDNIQIMIITGPNMSGKSALLRQTALITLMAQMGSFVPAKQATIGVVDGIFTRVGASDNISKGESTFMVEMQEASSILNNITDRSLVLFDELGRGTSTYDGISIAWAIVEYLHNNKKRAKTLFATHYHELNDLETILPRCKNFNVSAREVDGKMLFLRKLEPGGSAHSFGIQVAKLGGMPHKIVNRATDILHSLESNRSNPTAEGPTSQDFIDKPKVENIAGLAHQEIGVQMSIFQLDDPLLSNIREQLLNVDIDQLTPIEALNKLNDIQKLLKGY